MAHEVVRVVAGGALVGRFERGIHVALVDDALAGLGAQGFGLLDRAAPTVLRGVGFVPVHRQGALRSDRRPGRVGDDGDAGKQVHGVAVAVQDERVVNARHGLDLIEVRGRGLAADGRTLLVDGELHAGDGLIDPEERLATHQCIVVDAGDALAEQAELVRALQLQRSRIGNRHFGRLGSEVRVGELAPTRLVDDVAVHGAQLFDRHAEALGACADEHRPRRGAGLPQGHPVHRNGHGTARELHAVELGIDRRLFDGNIAPGGVEFLGDDHRQRRLHALANLGILGIEDDAFGVDAHIAVRLQRPARGGRARQGERQHEATADEACELHELTAVELVDAQRPVDSALALAGHGGDRFIDACVTERAHVRPSFMLAAAVLTPSRMRTYVPQRHRLPAIAASIAASSGSGLVRNSASAAMIWPAWQ